jgi:hypothetical protein
LFADHLMASAMWMDNAMVASTFGPMQSPRVPDIRAHSDNTESGCREVGVSMRPSIDLNLIYNVDCKWKVPLRPPQLPNTPRPPRARPRYALT